MKENKDFMLEAINTALQNVESENGGPFGAVIVKGGEIVGRGKNEVTATNDPTAHAEIVAIRDACKNLNTYDLSDCDLYASCEPCPMCLGSIYWAKINKLYYAATKEDAAKADFSDAHIYQEFSLTKENRSIPSSQLMREEAVKVFEKWIASVNKISY